MKIDGRCHCGYLSFEAEVDPESSRFATAPIARRFLAPPSGLSFPQSKAVSDFSPGSQTYVKTAASGNKRIQAFCPECGTQIYGTAADANSKFFGLRVGAIHQRDALIPKAQYWHRSAQTWVGQLGELPKFETQ